MCEFVSWKEYEGGVYFLQNSDVEKRLEEFKKYNPNWQEDICGHGAIEYFYPELESKGKNAESTSCKVKDYPVEIVEAIKKGKLSLIGFNLNFLNKKGREAYEKVRQSAREAYKKVEQPAWEAYEKVRQPALEAYEKVRQPALEAYEKVRQPAWEAYKKVRQPAWEAYKKVEQPAFWGVFKNKNNRLKEWQ